ncbi:type II toxin-antitoxin system VapC family toxin [Cyanobium gracile]|uniref:Ribonuclease VapC n=1 Tax=Cyanobium gracile UHCC 0281 TaxID=3110309 RepID=A0ABU5SXM9_9CYAN|nr:type II toxin-antitoxin system VapC family toxin [Cyanobium gracile]MEA5443259.1 type II toxin-antitoxin system VapC family toxin [Cyanobium gracile UHCC 0281]
MKGSPPPTRVVLDASAAIRVLTGQPDAAPLIQTLSSATLVIAPALMLTEVTNVIWKIGRTGGLGQADPQELLLEARHLVDHLEPDQALQPEALALALHLDHSVYDCLYLALARREAASLVSMDRRLLALAERVLP